MLNILKGIIIGVGKIIPGVSGSLIAISLGVYEKCINIISNFFNEIKFNYKFVFELCLGFLISFILLSKVIYYFITNHYYYTICFFIGLIIGTIPSIKKKINFKFNYKFFLILLSIFIIFYILGKFNIKMDNSIYSCFYTILIGFIDAATMIIPGISGTMVFMMLGVYEFVLKLFSDFMFPFIIFYLIGLIIGVFAISKTINFCLKKYTNEIYLLIFLFLIFSLLILIVNNFSKVSNLVEIIIGILLIFIGYFISYYFDKKQI